MSKFFSLGAGVKYNTTQQTVDKGQIIQMNGFSHDEYVVYNIEDGYFGLIYKLINMRTNKFEQCDIIRPLSQKFGIGYYYDDVYYARI